MVVVDQEKLMEHLDGDMELLQETFEMFCEEYKPMQPNLRAAFEAGDLESVEMVAHTLKGMISNFMALSACETLDQIQKIDDPGELSVGAPLLDKLSDQIDMMMSEIQTILVSGTK